MRLEEHLTFRTVRKKILFITKLAGVFLIFSYVILINMRVNLDVAFFLWMAFIILLTLCVDFLIRNFLSLGITLLFHIHKGIIGCRQALDFLAFRYFL